jgi:hypothetical protein
VRVSASESERETCEKRSSANWLSASYRFSMKSSTQIPARLRLPQSLISVDFHYTQGFRQPKLANFSDMLAFRQRTWESRSSVNWLSASYRFSIKSRAPSFRALLTESQGQNVALTVLWAPFPLTVL